MSCFLWQLQGTKPPHCCHWSSKINDRIDRKQNISSTSLLIFFNGDICRNINCMKNTIFSICGLDVATPRTAKIDLHLTQIKQIPCGALPGLITSAAIWPTLLREDCFFFFSHLDYTLEVGSAHERCTFQLQTFAILVPALLLTVSGSNSPGVVSLIESSLSVLAQPSCWLLCHTLSWFPHCVSRHCCRMNALIHNESYNHKAKWKW